MNEEILSKLRKILALTTSPSEGEASAAAGHLQRLLTKYNLDVADLEKRGSKTPGMREAPHDLGKAAFKWKLDLAEGIADHFYCAPLVNRQTKTVQFVGRPENVDALVMLYGWVIEQIRSIATTERRKHYDTTGEHIDPLRWQLGFGEGAVERLVVRLHEMKARQQEDMSRNDEGDVTALAVHHKSEVSDYLEEKFGYRTDGRLTKREQARQDRRRLEQEAQDEMRLRCEESGDMEPYYTAYPWERPETQEQKDAQAKRLADYLKKEAKNAKRRTGSHYRSGPAIDWDKEEQSGKARESGRTAASKVNLQPFIAGATERKKVG